MNLTGEQILPCSVEHAWELLNDPEILKACIPGCEELTKEGDTRLAAVVAVKIGPLKARFKGEVELSDVNPPTSYRISGKGSGGIAGFAQGGATVSLSEAEGGSLLAYEAEAQVGGKLAQLGTRLIDSTARKLALEFFDKLRIRIEEEAAADTAAT